MGLGVLIEHFDFTTRDARSAPLGKGWRKRNLLSATFSSFTPLARCTEVNFKGKMFRGQKWVTAPHCKPPGCPHLALAGNSWSFIGEAWDQPLLPLNPTNPWVPGLTTVSSWQQESTWLRALGAACPWGHQHPGEPACINPF